MNSKMVTLNLYILFLILLISIPVKSHSASHSIDYRLKLMFNTSDAGDIFADTNGYFKRAGLLVNVKEGSPEKNAINELELGYSHFGVASADQVIRALDKGAKIVVLAQLFQINPMQWIYRTDQPEIKTLNDLKGKNIGVTYGGNDETIMTTLLAKASLSKKDVKLTGVRFDFTPFFKRKVEIWPVYRNSQGVILQDRLQKEDEDVYFFDPSKFGVNFVANSVITSEKMMKNQPELVEKFLAALLQGWEAAMDPEKEIQVLEAVKQKDKGNNDEIRKKQLDATRPLVKPVHNLKIGTIDVMAWKQTEQIMLSAEQIKKPVNIETKLIIRE